MKLQLVEFNQGTQKIMVEDCINEKRGNEFFERTIK